MKIQSNQNLGNGATCAIAMRPVLLSLLMAACGDPTATNILATTAPTTTAAALTGAPATNAAPTTTAAPATVPNTTAAPRTVAATNSTAATTAKATTVAKDEQEVNFTSGKDTIYGTLLIPQTGIGKKLPAALLLSGSGPTDRDGNNPLIPGTINSHLNFARVLADEGIATLRYDKLGSGKTRLASYASAPAEIDFNVFVEEAQAAYNYLKSRPEIDPQRIMILGHSEGGLIALVLADQLKSSNEPKALVLAAPQPKPSLQIIREQIAAQYTQAQQRGQLTKEQANAWLAELDRIIKSLLDTGKIPPVTNPDFNKIFNRNNENFLAQIAKYDPAKVAADLLPTLPVLVLCGQKDSQVTCANVQYLMQGFQKAGNSKAVFYELANVNHVFKEVPGAPNPATDYGNPSLKFSQSATYKLADFVKANL